MYAEDKFEVSGFTPMASERVAPLRAAECPVHIEAQALAMHAASEDELEHARRDRRQPKQ